jgi:hypothetical protein
MKASWSSPITVDNNLRDLEDWINHNSQSRTAFWQVLNFLNAVIRSYHSTRRQGSEEYAMVCSFRDGISQEYHKLTSPLVLLSDSDVVTRMEALDTETQITILKDVRDRWRRYASKYTLLRNTRPELWHFLELMANHQITPWDEPTTQG